MRRGLWGAATVVLLLLSLPLPAHADDPTRSRSAAQDRANRAAARFSQAQSDLVRAEAAVADVEFRMQKDLHDLAGLQDQVQKIALAEYMRGEATPLFVFDKDVNRMARARALFRFVAVGDVNALDRYRATRQDLSAARTKLSAQLSSRKAALSAVQAEQKAAVAELDRLAAAERAAAAKKAQDDARRAAAEQASSKTKTAAPVAAAPAPAVVAKGAWICPVQGPHSFTDDYNAPRANGPHHATDILAPRGTPVVANVAGTVQQHPNGLGGLAYFLEGDDGRQYYGAHLDSFSGATGHVAAGTVIGAVGDSGNAKGGPTHLHFEIHVGGSTVNPYPTLKQYC